MPSEKAGYAGSTWTHLCAVGWTFLRLCRHWLGSGPQVVHFRHGYKWPLTYVKKTRSLSISMIDDCSSLDFWFFRTTQQLMQKNSRIICWFLGPWSPFLPMRSWRCHPHPCDMQPWWNLRSFWSSKRRHWPRVSGHKWFCWTKKGLRIGRTWKSHAKAAGGEIGLTLWSWNMVTICLNLMMFMQLGIWNLWWSWSMICF